jgi:hypothetical protein
MNSEDNREWLAIAWLNNGYVEREIKTRAYETIRLKRGDIRERNGRIALAAMLRDGSITKNMLHQLADLIDVDPKYPEMRLSMERRRHNKEGASTDAMRRTDILQTIYVELTKEGGTMTKGIEAVTQKYGITPRYAYQVWKEDENIRRVLWPHLAIE